MVDASAAFTSSGFAVSVPPDNKQATVAEVYLSVFFSAAPKSFTTLSTSHTIISAFSAEYTVFSSYGL